MKKEEKLKRIKIITGDNEMDKMKKTVKKAIIDFCIEFVNHPYLCYTEHGLHARFYNNLYNALPLDKRYIKWKGEKICVIQKEYRMADACGKSQRQHWDISIIQSPPSNKYSSSFPFDYLTLDSAVEFGLNENKEHLIDDINRLCHPKSNVNNRFVVHLYRISGRGDKKNSNRDLSPKSASLLSAEEITKLSKNKNVEIYLVYFDSTKKYQSGIWQIYNNEISSITEV